MRIGTLTGLMLVASNAFADSCVELVRFTSCPPSDDASVSYAAQFLVACRDEPADYGTTTAVLFRRAGYRGYETLSQCTNWFFGMPKSAYFQVDWNFTQPGIYVFQAEADPACPDDPCGDPPCNLDRCEVRWRVADIAVDVTLQNYAFSGPVTLRAELRDPVSGEEVRPTWLVPVSSNGTVVLDEAPFGSWKLRIGTQGGQWLSRVQDVLIDNRAYLAPAFSLRNGDANRDGCVDLADLNFVLLRFAQTAGPADLDNDGEVGVPDLAIVLVNFTRCSE